MTLNFDSDAEYLPEDERVLLRSLKDTNGEFLLPFAINEPDTVGIQEEAQRGNKA